MDVTHSDVTSTWGHKIAFVVLNGDFTNVWLQPSKGDSDAAISLNCFVDDVGVPKNLKAYLDGSHSGRHTDFI